MKYEDYHKYKWFFTSTDKLVIGGRSALQNDQLINEMKLLNTDFIVMHTSAPGSPFSVIMSETKKITKTDLEQTAIFTACFSKAWKSGKKICHVDLFKLSQLYKSKEMKTGTWGVKGEVERVSVPLELVLAVQKKVLRAVPESSVSEKSIILKILPGKIDKQDMLPKLYMELKGKFSNEELLSALPAGGIKILRTSSEEEKNK
jgi:hypothetical protein